MGGAKRGRLPLWLEGRCASYASTTPYGLYQDLLASWAGVALDQSQLSVSAAIKRAVSAVMGDLGLFPVLARVMGLEAAGTTAQMRPLELQQATFAAFRSIVSRLMVAGPTVLALEDLHWADPTSVILTQRAVVTCQRRPFTRRPHAPARPRPGCLRPAGVFARPLRIKGARA